MSKDNINIESPITTGKTLDSSITTNKVVSSGITTNLVIQSPIGVEDEAPLYSVEYQAVLDSWATLPSDAVQAEQNKMVEGWVNSGIWAGKDIIYVFASHTNDNGEALTNWKNPGTHDATLVNNPTFTAFEGFKGDGITQYIDTNYNPITHGVNYQQNDCSLSIYSNTDISESTFDIGISRAYIDARSLTGELITRLNGSSSILAAVDDSLGMSISSRLDFLKAYKNKTEVGNVAVLGGTVANFNFYVLALNNGSPIALSTRRISYSAIGANLTQQNVNDETDYFEAYMDSNGKGVIT